LVEEPQSSVLNKTKKYLVMNGMGEKNNNFLYFLINIFFVVYFQVTRDCLNRRLSNLVPI